MNKILFTILSTIFLNIHVFGQSMTEAEVCTQMNQAFELSQAGKYSEALYVFLIVGKNTEHQYTDNERQVYICSQTMACSCYFNLKNYKEGYVLAKKLRQINTSETEMNDINHQYVLNGYCYALDFIKRDNTGHAEYREGREILLSIAPVADKDMKSRIMCQIPTSWYMEGAEKSLSQKYDDALNCYEHALDGFHQIGSKKNEITVLKAIASVKNYTYDIEGSKKAYKTALFYAQQLNDTSNQMEILNGLYSLTSSAGNISLAQTYMESMDSLAERATSQQLKFEYYQLKGDEARGLGQYNLAEQWFLKGLNVAGKSDSQYSITNYHRIYLKLRDLFATIEQYDDAILYGKKALEEYRKVTSSSDEKYYLPYIGLADVYKRKGDKDGCYACLDSLFLGLSRTKEPRAIKDLLSTRARCHAAFGDYISALADFKKADEILSSKYSPSDGDRINLQAMIGGAEYHLGNYQEAESCYQNYANLNRDLYGTDSKEYIDALIYLANAEGFAEHIEDGCRDYVKACDKLKDLIKSRFLYMTPTEREGFWTITSSLFLNMTPYALKAGYYQTSFTRNCYNAILLSKAFLLESERSLYDAVKNEGSMQDMLDYERLNLMKIQLRELEKDYKQFSDSILIMSQNMNKLAKRLIGNCRSYSTMNDFIDVDYDTIKKTLAPNEIIIDFTDFISETTGRKYAAYIINSDQEDPLLKSLFTERQMDSLNITRPDMYYDAEYASVVIKLLWSPLKEYIAEGCTVYYIPSQLIFQISLESIPLEDGTLLGSHYNFVRLSSARELLKYKSRKKSVHNPQSAVLYGGLKYDLEPTTMAEEAKKYVLPELFAMRGDIMRGDSIFHELPGTKEEIAKIENILRRNRCKVTSFTGMKGTEESFLNMHGKSPQVLQIATHGFYYTPDNVEKINYLKGYSDAMSLSGIVLSGGNCAWLGKTLPKGVLGGILTANNIACLDLSGTEMVVLSACQSGQGKATSEGLYGLQRAFKKAGVGTIVTALWNVSDKVASEFMVTFYERLSDKEIGWDKRKAFEQAKQQIREKYPNPFYWASFVMVD